MLAVYRLFLMSLQFAASICRSRETANYRSYNRRSDELELLRTACDNSTSGTDLINQARRLRLAEKMDAAEKSANAWCARDKRLKCFIEAIRSRVGKFRSYVAGHLDAFCAGYLCVEFDVLTHASAMAQQAKSQVSSMPLSPMGVMSGAAILACVVCGFILGLIWVLPLRAKSSDQNSKTE